MWSRRRLLDGAAASRAMRMGSIGSLVPLLTAAAACSYVDHRDALAAPPANAKTSSVDCVSTTALLLFRGLGAGLAWTIGVDGYALAGMTGDEWTQRLKARGSSSIAREAARSMVQLSVRNMLGFASFLGIFGGVSCSLEKLRGKNDLLNPFWGGFTAGMVILPKDLRKLKTLLSSALLCGTASMALHYLVPTGENKNQRAER